MEARGKLRNERMAWEKDFDDDVKTQYKSEFGSDDEEEELLPKDLQKMCMEIDRAVLQRMHPSTPVGGLVASCVSQTVVKRSGRPRKNTGVNFFTF